MKHLLKKGGLFLILVVATIFSSCEKDLYEEAIIKTEPQSRINFLTIEQAPFLIPTIQAYNKNYDFLSTNSGALRRFDSNLNLDLDKIIEYVNANGLKTYSVRIYKEFQTGEDFYFENLHVFKTEQEYKSLIFRYNEVDDIKNFDASTFTGNLDIYKINYDHAGIIQYENGLLKCVKQDDCVMVGPDGAIIDLDCLIRAVSGGNPGTSWSGAGTTYTFGGLTSSNTNGNSNSGGNGNSGGNAVIMPVVFHPWPLPANASQFIYNLGFDNASTFHALKRNTQLLINNYIELNLNNPEELGDVQIILSNNPLITKISHLNEETQLSIFNYLIQNVFSVDSKNFAKEIVDLSINDSNRVDANNRIQMCLKLDTAGDNLFEDSFALTLDPYIDLDLQALSNPPSEISPNLFLLNTYLKKRLLKQTNPTWSDAKCWWEATKDIIHISLDAFGLIPVGGEVADLINGTLYVIEGDNVNAGFSFASAVPLVGWAAFNTKYAIKIKTAYQSTNKYKLVWKRLADGTIYFGTDGTCRQQLRKALNLVTGNPLIAHHIMPISLQSYEVMQKAFKSADALHLNEALNGIPLSSAVHSGSHANYTNLIKGKLISYDDLNPNATPQQCYNYVTNLISEIRVWIANNPNTNINNLVLP